MSVYDVLAQAIEKRRVVTFTYDGCFRVVEPFLLGTTTAGRPALRAYQTAGGSRSGTVPGWQKSVKASSVQRTASPMIG